MEVPRFWRSNQQRYRLAGEICDNCDKPMFPPRIICPDCGQTTHGEASIEKPQGNIFISEENAVPMNINSSLPTEVSMSSK